MQERRHEMKANPSGYPTQHNPKLESGYYTLIGLAHLKGITVEQLLTVYDVEHNEDSIGIFYNVAGKAV